MRMVGDVLLAGLAESGRHCGDVGCTMLWLVLDGRRLLVQRRIGGREIEHARTALDKAWRVKSADWSANDCPNGCTHLAKQDTKFEDWSRFAPQATPHAKRLS
jgi:hypothetical protein